MEQGADTRLTVEREDEVPVSLQSVANIQLHKQELKQEQRTHKHGSYHPLRSPWMYAAPLRPYCNPHHDKELLQP